VEQANGLDVGRLLREDLFGIVRVRQASRMQLALYPLHPHRLPGDPDL
jgi:hypothetical protein